MVGDSGEPQVVLARTEPVQRRQTRSSWCLIGPRSAPSAFACERRALKTPRHRCLPPQDVVVAGFAHRTEVMVRSPYPTQPGLGWWGPGSPLARQLGAPAGLPRLRQRWRVFAARLGRARSFLVLHASWPCLPLPFAPPLPLGALRRSVWLLPSADIFYPREDRGHTTGNEMRFRGRDAVPICGGLHRPRESRQCIGGSDREGKTTARPPGGVDG